MDLKSMLNESTVTRPPATTPLQPLQQPTRQQTYPPYNDSLPTSTTQQHQQQQQQRERPPQPPPLQPPESRTSSISYSSAQSPSQHTFASTSSIHSGGPHSAFALSPGQSHSAATTTRDGPLYNSQSSVSFVPSPAHASPHSHQGSIQQFQHQHRPPSGFPAGASLSTVGAPRDGSVPLSGPPHSSSRQFSPHPAYPSLPGTPLGPPPPFQRPSPQATQRAASYGVDHTRTHSSGSFGSAPGYDYGERSVSHAQHTLSRESSVRHYSYEREREKSMSVSPKTIPQPSPIRQASMEYSHPRKTPPPTKAAGQSPGEPPRLLASVEPRIDRGSLPSSLTLKEQDQMSSPHSSFYQSPKPAKQPSTPHSNTAMPAARSSPAAQRQPALKRAASAISGSSASPQPPRKRSKRDEVPIYARTARPNKPPLKLVMKDGVRSASSGPVLANGHPVNGNDTHKPLVSAPPVAAPAVTEPSDWEPSIMGSTPYEELTRYICDMIYNTIGNPDPPSDGAVFEVEAKLGEIHSLEEGRRLRLPVMTETIFDKSNFGLPTRFESSMNIEQHRALNSYLNILCAESQQPPRTPMFYDHPRETDTFYSLTSAGESTLPPSIRKYLNPKHRPRVRVTTTQNPGGGAGPGVVKRRIIKSRIADFEVHCPSIAFDYRISISIESPYDGPDDVLVKVNEAGAVGTGGGGEREKDRVSYRHLAYQIDLTQVSYPNSSKREHELEIEISTETIRQELANLREGRPSRYEDLVRGFVDNVRILARKGTLSRVGR